MIIEWYLNDIYRVLTEDMETTLFQGSLADCEAFYRLTKEGVLR